MILESFTDVDWVTFSGCETKNPLISRMECEDTTYTLIVDGAHIEAIFLDSNGFLNDTTVTGEFLTPGHAILFGLEAKGNETPEEIVNLGEKFGGFMSALEESLQAGRV